MPDLYKQGTRISLLGFNANNTVAYVASDIKTKVPSIYAVDLGTLKSTLVHEETVADIGGRGVYIMVRLRLWCFRAITTEWCFYPKTVS